MTSPPLFFHHIELQTQSARLLASTLARTLGMRVVAALHTGQGTSYCLQSHQAMIVCTSPMQEGCRRRDDTNAESAFHADIGRIDGVGVRAIGLSVSAIDATKAHLATVLRRDEKEVMVARKNGAADVFMPNTLGAIGLRFIACELYPLANMPSGMPYAIRDFKVAKDAFPEKLAVPGGIVGIDHIAVNVNNVPQVYERLKQVTGWAFFRKFEEDILQRPLEALTMRSPTAEGLLTIVQPTKKYSVFEDTLKANGGTCVHHIALRCGNILQFADSMFARGIWETMPAPSPEYYRDIKSTALEFLTDEEFKKLQRYGMLLDFENDCALIQVFLPYLGDVPGVFFELIGRVARRGTRIEGPPAPGCGGFGDRNVTQLYDCLVKGVEQWPEWNEAAVLLEE